MDSGSDNQTEIHDAIDLFGHRSRLIIVSWRDFSHHAPIGDAFRHFVVTVVKTTREFFATIRLALRAIGIAPKADVLLILLLVVSNHTSDYVSI